MFHDTFKVKCPVSASGNMNMRNLNLTMFYYAGCCTYHSILGIICPVRGLKCLMSIHLSLHSTLYNTGCFKATYCSIALEYMTPSTLNQPLNLLSSVNKSKCEIKGHLLKHKTCHFSMLLSL